MEESITEDFDALQTHFNVPENLDLLRDLFQKHYDLINKCFVMNMYTIEQAIRKGETT